jgi:hypothetical protein
MNSVVALKYSYDGLEPLSQDTLGTKAIVKNF